MRQKTEKELEQTREAMRALSLKHYFLFGESLDQEVSYDLQGDPVRIIKILGATAARFREIAFLLVAALRMNYTREEVLEMMKTAEEIRH